MRFCGSASLRYVSAVKSIAVAAVLVAAFGCNAPQQRTEPEPRARMEAPAIEPPLETESISDDEIQALAPPPSAARPPTPPATPIPPESPMACAWSDVWDNPDEPNPVLPGGGIEVPQRVHDVEVRLPDRELPASADLLVELVIQYDGAVRDVKVTQSFDPAWPQGEQAVVEAIRQWRYEPPRLGTTPMTVCVELGLRLQ